MTYSNFQEYGQLTIVHKTDSVSWKLYADNAVQLVKAMKDGKSNASLSVEESYWNGKTTVSRASHISLDKDSIDVLIAKLQQIKSELV